MVKALRSLVNSVPGHSFFLKFRTSNLSDSEVTKDRSGCNSNLRVVSWPSVSKVVFIFTVCVSGSVGILHGILMFVNLTYLMSENQRNALSD